MSDLVITRFAPSPTGQLHIGGVRTALFNWLYAKHTGGKMLLRIEDTDRERFCEQATQAIFDALSWLGLSWDDQPVFQYERMHRHQEVAYELLRSGHAYYCYATPQELEEMRESARQKGLPPRYDRRWRDQDPQKAPPSIKPALRIKAPLTGETVLKDCVQGIIRFPNKDLDDFIILRSDETSTYMHAGVVDDHDMGITHIIRGDDHLTNAVRQTVIYSAMGWEIPIMAHIPLIHGSDGAKLSKRHGATAIEAYRDMGYLPDALLNYLVRLGWSHGDDEVMSLSQMIEWFDIIDINKSAARFDFSKLDALNAVHMRKMPDEKLLSLLINTLQDLPKGQEISEKLNAEYREKLLYTLPSLKERSKTLQDLIENIGWLFLSRPLFLEDSAQKILVESSCDTLYQAYNALSGITEDWTKQTTEQAIKICAQNNGLKLGEIAQPLRAALTGKSVSPGLFDVLFILGPEESLARIFDQISLKNPDFFSPPQ